MIEEQTLKSENNISLFTNKEMLVFDGKMDSRPSDNIIIRDIDRSAGPTNNSGKAKSQKPTMRELV
jgi:hypothetical protein